MKRVCFEVWIELLDPITTKKVTEDYFSMRIIDFRKKYKVSSLSCKKVFGLKRLRSGNNTKNPWSPIYTKISEIRARKGINVREDKFLPGCSLKNRK